MKRLLLLFILLTIVLSACNNERTFKIEHAQRDESEIKELRNVLEEEKRLNNAVAVILDGDLIAAGRVKPFSRFNKKKIENELQKKIEKAFPDHDVLFSADLKIYWEIEELMRIDSSKKQQKRLDKIKSLSKEET